MNRPKYESPIEIIANDMKMQFDDDVVKYVQSYKINVNKEELVKALNYDRQQYNKGYEDAEEYYQKALDKAIEVIANTNYHFTPEEIEDNKKSWKEVLLTDADYIIIKTKENNNRLLKLEKALDKACDKLEWYSFALDIEEKIKKEEWKEWALKDE